MMYKVPQEIKDRNFKEWLSDKEHYISLMQNGGYTREEAMEFIKLWILDGITSALINH